MSYRTSGEVGGDGCDPTEGMRTKEAAQLIGVRV
jgi:hypothetical protein